jgi:hypothetical protein
MKTVVVRLVNHGDGLSKAIISEQGGMIAHAEVPMPGTQTVIGAYAEHGVIERPLNYDDGKFEYETFVLLEVEDAVADAFHHYLRAVAAKKEPYDFPGLIDYVQFLDLHKKHWVFCSALVVDAMRLNRGAVTDDTPRIFPRGLPKPAHFVSPVWLQQMLYARPDIKIISRDSPEFIAHTTRATRESE